MACKLSVSDESNCKERNNSQLQNSAFHSRHLCVFLSPKKKAVSDNFTHNACAVSTGRPIGWNSITVNCTLITTDTGPRSL